MQCTKIFVMGHPVISLSSSISITFSFSFGQLRKGSKPPSPYVSLSVRGVSYKTKVMTWGRRKRSGWKWVVNHGFWTEYGDISRITFGVFSSHYWLYNGGFKIEGKQYVYALDVTIRCYYSAREFMISSRSSLAYSFIIHFLPTFPHFSFQQVVQRRGTYCY